MKARRLLITLMALIPLTAFGRLLQIIDPKTLIADSRLVFVGRVQSIKSSNITTPLSYPTWEGVSFRWLKVDMEVLEPFKGVRKGDIVQTMMLSMDRSKQTELMYSPPVMLEPDKGDVFFLCLCPTPTKNAFAGLTAPYNEELSMFPLHRSGDTTGDSVKYDVKQLLLDDKRFTLIWKLVNQTGQIVPGSVARLRDNYTVEIGNVHTNKVVYLEWQAYTNAHGWVSDVPKGFSQTNSNGKK